MDSFVGGGVFCDLESCGYNSYVNMTFLNIVCVQFWGPVQYQKFTKVDKSSLHLYAIKISAHSRLKGSRHVAESEWHFDNSLRPAVLSRTVWVIVDFYYHLFTISSSKFSPKKKVAKPDELILLFIRGAEYEWSLLPPLGLRQSSRPCTFFFLLEQRL